MQALNENWNTLQLRIYNENLDVEFVFYHTTSKPLTPSAGNIFFTTSYVTASSYSTWSIVFDLTSSNTHGLNSFSGSTATAVNTYTTVPATFEGKWELYV